MLHNSFIVHTIFIRWWWCRCGWFFGFPTVKILSWKIFIQRRRQTSSVIRRLRVAAMVCAHIRNKSHNNFRKLTVIFRAVILIDLLCCLDVTTNLSRCYISHFPLARNTSCLLHPSPTATFSFSKGSSGFLVTVDIYSISTSEPTANTEQSNNYHFISHISKIPLNRLEKMRKCDNKTGDGSLRA